MSTAVYVTVETSPAGEHVVGVFTSLEQARAVLRSLDVDRLADYRIEFHLLDEPPRPSPWTVVLARDGAVCDVAPFVGCSACDLDQLMADASFIEDGGERMRVAVWAPTPGRAIAAADALRRRLVQCGAWGTERVPLAPLHAPGPSAPTAAGPATER